MQLARVARYGAGEYCSTEPFFHIRTKVGLEMRIISVLCVRTKMLSTSNMEKRDEVGVLNKATHLLLMVLHTEMCALYIIQFYFFIGINMCKFPSNLDYGKLQI